MYYNKIQSNYLKINFVIGIREFSEVITSQHGKKR